MKHLKKIYEDNSLKFENYLMEYFCDIKDIIEDECDDIHFNIEVEFNKFEKISSAYIIIDYRQLFDNNELILSHRERVREKYFKDISRIFNEFSNIISNLNRDKSIFINHLSHKDERILISISEV